MNDSPQRASQWQAGTVSSACSGPLTLRSIPHDWQGGAITAAGGICAARASSAASMLQAPGCVTPATGYLFEPVAARLSFGYDQQALLAKMISLGTEIILLQARDPTRSDAGRTSTVCD